MSKKFDNIINSAIEFARNNQHEYLMIDHLAWALVQDKDIQTILAAMNVKQEVITKEITEHMALDKSNTLAKTDYTTDMPTSTKHVERVLRRAVTHKLLSSNQEMTPDALLLSILCEDKNASSAIFHRNGVTRDGLVKQLKKSAVKSGSFGELEKYCVNLNQECKNGRIDPVIGRETEVQDVIEAIARRKKNNAILVGHAGVGKTAVAEGLARKIVEGEVPEAILNKVVYSLSITNMVAGTKYRGEFEERMKKVLEQIRDLGNVILFIDEIHMIMGAGEAQGGSMDASNMLKPMLANGELTCIGATTYDEFATHLDKDRALMRRFQKIDINPPSVEDTKRILEGLSSYYADYHGVTFEEGTLDACVDLSERYIKSRFLPDKAIDVMDFAGAKAKLDGKTTVNMDVILERVSKISKVPLEMIDLRENEMLRNLDKKIKDKVFGQDSAIDLIVESIGLSKAGLREGNKPVGSFLFVGPTGVGKTHICKTVAKCMGTTLVKFDMSEYQEAHTVSRLIGAPPGYVGHGAGEAGSGQLIAEVEKNPSCVLLLDEIEKAAPQVLTVLLQVMEDGILTSSTGKKVDFTNVILIMTSNLGAADAERRSIGINNNTNEARIMEAVKKELSPEFRNRLDHIIEFKKLTIVEMGAIVDQAIVDLNESMSSKKVSVEVSVTARQWLADKGYEPTMGARPFKRLFENEIKKPLSKELLYGDLVDGGKVLITLDGDKLLISVNKYQEEIIKVECLA